MAVIPAAGQNLLVDGAFEGLSPTGTQAVGVYLGGHTDGWWCLNGGNYLYWDWGGARGQYDHLNGAIIQQVFATTPGTTYDVSFQAVASEAATNNQHVNVWMDDGNVVNGSYSGGLCSYSTPTLEGNYSPGITEPWTVYSFQFTATGTQSTITVQGSYRLAVDDFMVTAPPPPSTGDLTINKFFDCYADGAFEAPDKMLTGQSVTIDGVGGYHNVADTDANGQIALTGLTAGEYTITETLKSDHAATTAAPMVVTVTAGSTAAAWIGERMAADINQDGIVDSQDFTQLKAMYGQSGKTWTDGDVSGGVGFLGDGVVDSQDFTALKASYGKGAMYNPAAVPEPASLSLLLIGAAMAIRRRRHG